MTGVIEGQRVFSVEEYHRMGKAGVFPSGERLELIRGVIHDMTPKGRRHVQAVTLASHLLIPKLHGRAIVLVQDPVTLAQVISEPEPDLAVLATSDPRDAGSEDQRALLVIEVADTSLHFDSEDKARIYAEAGIEDYWIVNLVDNVLEIFRDPCGGEYRERRVLQPTDHVAPLSFPDLQIAIRDLLP